MLSGEAIYSTRGKHAYHYTMLLYSEIEIMMVHKYVFIFSGVATTESGYLVGVPKRIFWCIF
jgi:hypothetical protein